MVDFNKLSRNVKSGKMRERIAAESKIRNEKDEANRFMAAKLLEMVENDKIDSDYDCGFIRSVMVRINSGLPLSEKQEAHLEKCFHERY